MPGHGHAIGFGASSISFFAAAGVTVGRVTLSNFSINELAPSGSTIGTLSVLNGQGAYTFTVKEDPDGKFTVVGDQLRTDAALNYESATSHAVTIRAENGADDPIDLVTTISVLNAFEGPTFNPLALSASTATQVEAATINILGATPGSTITGAVPDGMTLDSTARTISGTPTVVGEFAFDLAESGLDSEPRASSVSITVEEPASGAPPLDFFTYGQSNNVFWGQNGDGAVTAHPETLIWDRDAGEWVTPTGNGVVEFLNAMQAATGRACRLVRGGVGGVPISFLQKNAGTGYYEKLITDIAASDITPAFIIWHHGEGDAAGSAPTAGDYQDDLDTLHGSVITDLGLTRAALPIVLSSLATTTDTSVQSDEAWDTIQNDLATINASYPNIHFSHSNMPADRVDDFHWTPASYGKSGRLSAQTVQVLMGLQSTRPSFDLEPVVERISPTQTRVTVIHGLGTDFTPATGITGFEVSGDAGSTWIDATAARESATSIILTHADLGTGARLIEYQRGRNPDVSGAVQDNSPLAVPLEYTVGALLAVGEGAAPVLTYQDRAFVSDDETQSFSISFPNTVGEESLCIIRGGHTGTLITADEVRQSEVGQWPSTFLYQALIPAGTSSISGDIVYDELPFDWAFYQAWTSPTSGLNSLTPVTNSAREPAAQSISVSLATDEGGFTIISAQTRSERGVGVLTGDETYTIREALEFQGSWVVADAQEVAADAASDVEVSFDAPNVEVVIVGATWR